MIQPYGWAGKVLWVDLTDRKVTQIPTSDFEPEKYIGGVGLNSRIFWELGCPKVDAFHPDNPVIISNGPLAGASGPFSRATASSIAPQAYPKQLFTYSGCGGKFPSELKYAGYDAVVVVGKSDSPVYVSVLDGEAEIRDAKDLWGLDTFATQQALMNDHPQACAHVIGPAGENLSPTAVIMTETTGAAGNGGYGAVMGSKNLKAIVVRGTGSLRIADPDAFTAVIRERKDAGEWIAPRNVAWGRTANCNAYLGKELKDRHSVRLTGCYGCFYQCHGVFDIPGIGKGAQMCADCWYGYFCPESVDGMWEANILSQKLGINNFELLGIMGFLVSTIRKGILKREDVGLSEIPAIDRRDEPENGPPEVHHAFLNEFLTGIANGTSLFSKGLSWAAESLGPEALQESYKTNPAWGNMKHHIVGVGEALHYATDNRDPFNSCQDYNRFGGNGIGNNKEIADWFGIPGGYLKKEYGGEDEMVYDGIEEETIWIQHHQSVKNALHICELSSCPGQFFHPPDMDIRIFESRLLSAATGIDYDVDGLWDAGERIYNLRRAVMVLREDRQRDEDTLAPVWYEKLVSGGPPEPIDREKWEAVKDRFYERRGWSVDNGWPTRVNLESLGMKNIADGLETAGKLG